MTGELERQRRAREVEDDRDDRRGTPGRTTLTSRLPASAGSIARAVVQQLQAKGDLDGPEVHAVAAHGLTGAASTLPFLDQIQRAFGHHDISGVRAHVGGPAGEAAMAMGASAYASGDAVAFASAPDVHLAAHEAAHVVQQRGGVRLSGGVGRAGDEYEANADAVADRVVRGESAQDLLDPFSHRGSSGGPAVQRDEDGEEDHAWLARLRHDGHGGWTSGGRALSQPELRRLRRILARQAPTSVSLRHGELAAYRRHLHSVRPPLDAATWITAHRASESAGTQREEMTEAVGAPQRSEGSHPEQTATEPTRVDEEREAAADQTGTSHGSTRGGMRDHARGGRRRSTETLDDGTEARVDQIDETRRRVTGQGVEERTERGRRAEALHGPTLAIDLRDELERRRAQLRREQAAASTDGEREAIRARRRQLVLDIRALSEPDVSIADATEIAERQRVPLVREGDVTTGTRVTDVNPLDGVVGRGRRTEREVHDREGNSGRTVEHRSTQVDLGAGALESRTDEEMSARTADGSQMTERTSVTARVQVGDGRVESTDRWRSESEDIDADGTERRTATETAGSVGMIVSAEETGARFGRSSRTEEGTEAGSAARETSGALEITDRRVGATGSHEREGRRGDWRGTARASADGSFSIDVTPMEDGSGRYTLTFTIHVGVAGSVSGSRRRESGDGLRGSASLRGSAQGDLITARMISETEARRYLAAADRADRGEAVDDPPEFGRVARLRAAGEGADALLQAGAVFGSGDTAAAMQDGDSITLDTQVGVGGDVSAGGTRGGVGIDVEAGGDARWRRTVQVERITVGGHVRVRVTVTYRNETEWHAGGTASARVGAARVRHAEEQAATDSVQFVLDPSAATYDESYRRIVQTTDRAELRALEGEYAASVRRSRHAESGAEEDEHEVGPISEAMIGARTRSHGSDDVTVMTDHEGNRSLEGRVEGGSDRDVRLRVHDQDIDLGGQSESVRADLDRDGMRLDIEAREQQIDPIAAIRDAAADFSEADRRERAALVMARSPTEHLTHALRQFEHRWGYHLAEHDLEVMSTRARASSRWSACCIVPDRDVLAAWHRLRGALANPQPRRAEAEIDRGAAVNLARARSLSAWMQAAAGNGADCLERVLRRWGESTTHEASDERLGRGYEWPVSLRHASTSYDTLVTQAQGMRERFERALARPDGGTEAEAHFREVSRGLDNVVRQVRACSDFHSEARRSELIREIEQHRADINLRYREFQRRWGELRPDALQSGGADVAAPTADAIAATRTSREEYTAERSRSFARAMIRTLRDNHTRERQMLQAVQAALPADDSGPLLGARGRAEAASLCTQVHDLHRTWIQQVEDLRQAYTQAGTPESAWQVSTGPDAPRNRQLEPNIGWLIIEYRRAMRFSLDAYAENRIAQWREEGRY